MRNAELTELPMILPTELYVSNLDDMAADVAATTMHVMMTTL
jgi:hypothetical protein